MILKKKIANYLDRKGMGRIVFFGIMGFLIGGKLSLDYLREHRFTLECDRTICVRTAYNIGGKKYSILRINIEQGFSLYTKSRRYSTDYYMIVDQRRAEINRDEYAALADFQREEQKQKFALDTQKPIEDILWIVFMFSAGIILLGIAIYGKHIDYKQFIPNEEEQADRNSEGKKTD